MGTGATSPFPRLSLLALAPLLLVPARQAPTSRVLVIGIDGCRLDALQAAATPNLDALIAGSGSSDSGLTRALGQDGTLSYPTDFPGDFDELQIWSRVLGAAEVLNLYAGAGFGGCSAGS